MDQSNLAQEQADGYSSVEANFPKLSEQATVTWTNITVKAFGVGVGINMTIPFVYGLVLNPGYIFVPANIIVTPYRGSVKLDPLLSKPVAYDVGYLAITSIDVALAQPPGEYIIECAMNNSGRESFCQPYTPNKSNIMTNFCSKSPHDPRCACFPTLQMKADAVGDTLAPYEAECVYPPCMQANDGIAVFKPRTCNRSIEICKQALTLTNVQRANLSGINFSCTNNNSTNNNSSNNNTPIPNGATRIPDEAKPTPELEPSPKPSSKSTTGLKKTGIIIIGVSAFFVIIMIIIIAIAANIKQ